MFSRECIDLWGSNCVVVHHDSLSKSIRGESETFMKDAHYGVCVATMTLEIGIDVGDIDAIVLAEIPWSKGMADRQRILWQVICKTSKGEDSYCEV